MQTLHERLTAAGLTPTEIRPTSEGLAAVSGLATLTDHRVVFAKTFAEEPLGDVFPQEAEGLAVLRAAGSPPRTSCIAGKIFSSCRCCSRVRTAPGSGNSWRRIFLTCTAQQ